MRIHQPACIITNSEFSLYSIRNFLPFIFIIVYTIIIFWESSSLLTNSICTIIWETKYTESKVCFILYLMKFKYVPLPAQHLGTCNIWNIYLKMSYAIYIPLHFIVDRSFLLKETDLHIPAQKTPGPSESQRHARRIKQVSQFMLGGKWYVFEFHQVLNEIDFRKIRPL